MLGGDWPPVFFVLTGGMEAQGRPLHGFSFLPEREAEWSVFSRFSYPLSVVCLGLCGAGDVSASPSRSRVFSVLSCL